MYVKQISVFVENTPGRLAHFTRLLGENHIDLVSLSVADTTNFGILRGIVADYERAVRLLGENGYTVKLTDVLAVSVPDKPGGLADVLDALAQENVSVEYLYSFVRSQDGHALIILRVDQLEKAQQVLEKEGVKLLSQEEIRAL